MKKTYTQEEIDRLLECETAYKSVPENKRSQRKAAKTVGLKRTAFQNALLRLSNLRLENPSDQRLINRSILSGSTEPIKAKECTLPKKGKIKRYILTSAQNNTKIHEEFWENLLAYSSYLDAKLMVATFTYSHNNNSEFTVKRNTNKEQHSLWWSPTLCEHGFEDERVQLAPDLIWCGDINISPTATDPVASLDSFNGLSSNIFPHAKVRQKAVPVQKGTNVKRNITTGTVTQLNYVQRKAGKKAEFDHVFAATIVEVNSSGEWFHRQLVAESETGTFYDLDKYVSGGKVSDVSMDDEYVGVMGDIHSEQMAQYLWGPVWNNDDSIMKSLPIKTQVLHDLLDFKSQNHHENRNVFAKYNKWFTGKTNVELELERTAYTLNNMTRQDVQNIVSYSNHDDMLERWLGDPNNDFRADPENALFFLKMMHRRLESIKLEEQNFSIFEYAIGEALKSIADWVNPWVMEQTYFCPNVDDTIIKNGIEIAKHGHVGTKGSRGSLNQLAKLGQKIIVGHYHEAGIDRGAMSVGVFGNLDMGYNIGYGTWTHTMALIYPNGKRALVDIKLIDGTWKWRL